MTEQSDAVVSRSRLAGAAFGTGLFIGMPIGAFLGVFVL